MLTLSSVTHAALVTGFVYVTDYGKSELDRYQYTYDQTLNKITGVTAYGINHSTNPNSAYFLGGSSGLSLPVKEGIHGTANDLILVSGAHGSTSVTSITRYDLKGNIIGNIPVNFSAYAGGGAVGIGNALVTDDGKFMYAPLEAGNAIVKIDMKTGNIVHSYTFNKAHDVAIAKNGDVYAANYANGSASVIRLDADLNYKQVLVANTAGFRPSGLSIAADGSLYVQDNRNNGGYDSVRHYNLSGTGTLTATYDATKSYIGSATKNALEFTFGNNIGPDGKLYIAALGGGGNGGFGTRAGYVDGIYAFDPSTGGVSRFINGFTEKTGPASANGLSAPKYVQFDTNFASHPDAGYSPVPEPGTLPMVIMGIVLTQVSRRLLPRRKSRNS
jgi:hypothetical protein